MRLRVEYYGALRARLGRDGDWLELAEGSSARDAGAVVCAGLGPEWPGCLRYGINDALADAGQALRSGDRIALLPPVCGGAPSDRLGLSAEPLDVAGILASLEDASCGALGVFVGRVRDQDGGRPVESLEYEAHPGLALAVLEALAAEARGRWELGPLGLVHRTGTLAVGDVAVVAAATAAHRVAAFEACRFLVEEAKVRLPVWKRQRHADGSHRWIGAPE